MRTGRPWARSAVSTLRDRGNPPPPRPSRRLSRSRVRTSAPAWWGSGPHREVWAARPSLPSAATGPDSTRAPGLPSVPIRTGAIGCTGGRSRASVSSVSPVMRSELQVDVIVPPDLHRGSIGRLPTVSSAARPRRVPSPRTPNATTSRRCRPWRRGRARRRRRVPLRSGSGTTPPGRSSRRVPPCGDEHEPVEGDGSERHRGGLEVRRPGHEHPDPADPGVSVECECGHMAGYEGHRGGGQGHVGPEDGRRRRATEPGAPRVAEPQSEHDRSRERKVGRHAEAATEDPGEHPVVDQRLAPVPRRPPDDEGDDHDPGQEC